MTMAEVFSPHEVTWTPERSANYWDHLASLPAFAGHYFSAHSGQWVVGFARRFGPLSGQVLDFGCGAGHLLAHLMAAGIACEGLDFSPKSIEAVRQRFAGHPLFRGATIAEELPTPVAGGTKDVVFCVEVLEHLLDADLEPTLTELRRLLKPGGLLVVTTPHGEALALNQALCPECGCLFHRYQHVRSWSATTLQAAMERHGFTTLACEATTLGLSGTAKLLRKTYWLVTGRPKLHPPHLLYAGRCRNT